MKINEVAVVHGRGFLSFARAPCSGVIPVLWKTKFHRCGQERNSWREALLCCFADSDRNSSAQSPEKTARRNFKKLSLDSERAWNPRETGPWCQIYSNYRMVDRNHLYDDVLWSFCFCSFWWIFIITWERYLNGGLSQLTILSHQINQMTIKLLNSREL